MICFNPRAHEGRDSKVICCRLALIRFNPRAHEGRDAVAVGPLRQDWKFQSTRPRGARQDKSVKSAVPNQFQSHAPTRGATVGSNCAMLKRTSFNPRAHEGRDQQYQMLSVAQTGFQSTRPRGARLVAQGTYDSENSCFNPRAHEGRDGSTRLNEMEFNGFNPRAHEGRDDAAAPRWRRTLWFQSTRPRGARRKLAFYDAGNLYVSIHAPTRGATWLARTLLIWCRCFNPRAHEGRDEFLRSRFDVQQRFNPRAHEGRDSDDVGARRLLLRFNPRAHEGRDPGPQSLGNYPFVSIHAPTRGATRHTAPPPSTRCRFNPRAHEGRDAAGSKFSSTVRSFNPRAHEGRD